MNVEHRKALSLLAGALALAREHSEEMPVQMLAVLVVCLMEPGIPLKDLPPKTGLSQSAASRNVNKLGMRGDRAVQYKPMGLLETREDPADWRRRVVYPTAKGLEFMENLTATVNAVLERYARRS